MQFTFEMYDFDNDGYITSEDVRIMMSYMAFNRVQGVQIAQSVLDQRGIEKISGSRASSPTNRQKQQRQKQKEGIYLEEEGKNVDYKDRISDQEEIKNFTESIFTAENGITKNKMNYKQYEHINKNVSSEMFYSLMCVLHERLSCSQMYFKMRKDFKDKQKSGYSSPVRQIASPKMIRGLSIPKAAKDDSRSSPQLINPDVRIKNLKHPSKKPSNNQTTFSLATKQDYDDTFGSASKKQENDYPRGGSPHKISRHNKLRGRYEESKGSAMQDHEKMAFSPINKNKALGLRMNMT